MSDDSVQILESDKDQLLLIAGESGTGKSMSLRNLPQERTMYLRAEPKRLPFKHKFEELKITDPFQVHAAIAEAEDMPDIEYIVIDSITFLFEMFETMYVTGAADGRAAWGAFQQFWLDLIYVYVAKSTKKIIMIAHTQDMVDKISEEVYRAVPVKGALKNKGIEAYFSHVVYCKVERVKALEKDYMNEHLNINDDERDLGIKNVFQTRKTKTTIKDRIRNPMDLFTVKETFIDNDAKALMDIIVDYHLS